MTTDRKVPPGFPGGHVPIIGEVVDDGVVRLKLSAPMQAAMIAAITRKGRLERWENGFWTYAGCPARMVGGVITPDECFTWQTIKALIDRGLLKGVGDGKYLVEVEVA